MYEQNRSGILRGGRAHTETHVDMKGISSPHSTFVTPAMLLTSTTTLLPERQVGRKQVPKAKNPPFPTQTTALPVRVLHQASEDMSVNREAKLPPNRGKTPYTCQQH